MDVRPMLGMAYSKEEEMKHKEVKFHRTMSEAFGPYTSDELHPMCSGPCNQGRKKCPVPSSCFVQVDVNEPTGLENAFLLMAIIFVIAITGALIGL
jgi:hypothetical protein